MDPITIELGLPVLGIILLSVAIIVDLVSKTEPVTDRLADGYIVIRRDKQLAPGMYWYVGAYNQKRTAKKIARRCGNSATYRPFRFLHRERTDV